MKIKYLSKAIAQTEMELWKKNNNTVKEYRLDPSYLQLRESLYLLHRKLTVQELGKYDYDLNFALGLYSMINKLEGFNLRAASRDDFWVYLSIQVIPEIVEQRWGIEAEARFYSLPRRIWLKTLYFYILLSWQGTEDNTREILRGNSTDTILQLTERPSSKGYNIELYRKLMFEYDYYKKVHPKDPVSLFRKIMKLNTAYIKTLDPSLFEGGTDGYVEWLFSQ